MKQGPPKILVSIWLFGLLIAGSVTTLAACQGGWQQRPDKVPGETDRKIREVQIQTPSGQPTQLNPQKLYNRLGQRRGNVIFTPRYFNPYRVAEDRRRVLMFWHTNGYFDAQVIDSEVRNHSGGDVTLMWVVDEGVPYTIDDIQFRHAPPEHLDALRDMVIFDVGDGVELESYRKVRIGMAEYLHRQGYGHARVYSRAYVDRERKTVSWYYFIDGGPRTRVGHVTVSGNKRIPAERITQRLGLDPGERYSLDANEKARLDLLDSGSFASVLVESDADIEILIGKVPPDTGGIMQPEQVSDDGRMIPRPVSEDIALNVNVVEAPAVQTRLHAGGGADASRLDAFGGASLVFRDLFGPFHHITLEGRAGYGWLWRGDTQDPTGVYGDALIRYNRPGLIWRLFDARLTARFRQELYPGFFLRELTTGPGVRSALATGLFLDIDVLFRMGWQVDFGPFDDATRDALSLPDDDTMEGAIADIALTWDRRDQPVEATKGTFARVAGQVSPGGPLGTHQYLQTLLDLRGFIPVATSWSFAARAAWSGVVWSGDEGVPLGPRRFGGGAFGLRGFGRQQLSPRVLRCDDVTQQVGCEEVLVGGLSLFESSLEMRYLPYRLPYGAGFFIDAGGVGADLNPFASGLSMAAGLGLRLRTWYIPIAIDISYRLLRDNNVQPFDDIDSFQFFLRIGEAF